MSRDSRGLSTRHPALRTPDWPLSRRTSLKVGGPARYGLETDDADQAAGAIADAARAGLPVLCLGGGSNLLVADDGFDGLVVKYTADDFEVIERSDSAG